jgi:3'-phosphoadenosine 5'-phosphosulfate sulfotransferase (PAPS reductase)/FAD synthetase
VTSAASDDHRHHTRYREPAPHLELGFADDVPFEHDPLDPHPEHPTPIDQVLRLTLPQRERRVERLVELADERFAEAIATHAPEPGAVVAVCGLVSGGNDSYTVAHLLQDRLTHVVHANTGTGIEATRQHVRDTAAAWGLPLIEKRPAAGQGYFDLVRGDVWAQPRDGGPRRRVWAGFPGPAAHAVMQQRLKGRCLEQVPHELGVSGSRTQRIVYVAGRRRSESRRRASVPHHERLGTIVWSSPIAVWHKADLRAYRLMAGIRLHRGRRCRHVPMNPIAVRLGLSGECGCLANAVEGERERWFAEFPDDPFLLQVLETEELLAGPGYEFIPEHRKRWAWGAAYVDPEDPVEMGTDSLCGTNCGPDPIADEMDPLFEWGVA